MLLLLSLNMQSSFESRHGDLSDTAGGIGLQGRVNPCAGILGRVQIAFFQPRQGQVNFRLFAGGAHVRGVLDIEIAGVGEVALGNPGFAQGTHQGGCGVFLEGALPELLGLFGILETIFVKQPVSMTDVRIVWIQGECLFKELLCVFPMLRRLLLDGPGLPEMNGLWTRRGSLLKSFLGLGMLSSARV